MVAVPARRIVRALKVMISGDRAVAGVSGNGLICGHCI